MNTFGLPLILAQTSTDAPKPAAPADVPGPVIGPAPAGSPAPAPGAPAGTSQQPLPNTTTAQRQASPTDWLFPVMLLGVIVLFFFMTWSGQRKERKRREALLNSLGKGDKVQTVGGMLGTITEVRDDEVMVKVDENSDLRIRFNRSAIQSVLEKRSSN